MSFRGRGRGRGGRGFGAAAFEQRFAKHEPYILFPEDVELPDLSHVNSLKKEYIPLISRKLKLENFWKTSCYHLEDSASRSMQSTFIERYSDKIQQKSQAKREALQSYLRLIPSNFPAELIQGSKLTRRDQKRLRWDGDPDDRLFEKFEKLEESHKVDENGEKEKKDENEEEEEEQLEGEDEESSDDGDYNQNIDFDDDEDDLNMEEEEHEDAYE